MPVLFSHHLFYRNLPLTNHLLQFLQVCVSRTHWTKWNTPQGKHYRGRLFQIKFFLKSITSKNIPIQNSIYSNLNSSNSDFINTQINCRRDMMQTVRKNDFELSFEVFLTIMFSGGFFLDVKSNYQSPYLWVNSVCSVIISSKFHHIFF